MKKCITMCEIYLFLTLSDGALTYLTAPNLSDLGNPLAKSFGVFAVILANILACLLYVYLAYYIFLKYKTKQFNVNSPIEYACMILYDRSDKPLWLLYKTPKHISPVIALFGFSYVYSMPLARIVLLSEKLFSLTNINMTPYYKIKDFLFGRPDVVISSIVCIVLMIYWFKIEYKKSKTL